MSSLTLNEILLLSVVFRKRDVNIPAHHSLSSAGDEWRQKLHTTILVRERKKLTERKFSPFWHVSCYCLLSTGHKKAHEDSCSISYSTVCLSLWWATHTATGINGMAQCRQTQSSCKAPTPQFFCDLVSLIAHLHPSLQISLQPTWQTTNQQSGIHHNNHSVAPQCRRCGCLKM